jgi:hypothetical protein
VCADVQARLVSLERAREVYGVVLQEATDGSFEIDAAATRRTREGN